MDDAKRVAELEGSELDAWVAKAAGVDAVMGRRGHMVTFYARDRDGLFDGRSYCPSSHWSDGGPIIERLRPLEITACHGNVGWYVRAQHAPCDGDQFYGDTLLIAAMRSFVASKFGRTVEAQP